MTDNGTNNDDFTGDDDTSGDGNAAKALRKQNAKLAADLRAREDELATFRKEKRAGDLTSLLAAKGGKAGWAKYAAADIEGDVTEAAVLAWLETEGAQSFDWTAPEADEPDPAEAANRDGARRIANATRTAPAGESAWTPERMRTASNQELIAAGILKL